MSSIRFLAAAVLAASLTLPVAALAQQAPPVPAGAAPAGASEPGETGRHHGHHRGAFRAALAGLNLSAAQKTQIDQVFARTKAANRGADPATRKANREQLHAQIEAILSPAQRTQLQSALQQSRREHRRRG